MKYKGFAKVKFIVALVLVILLTGCSSMRFNDFFSSYTEQMQPVRQATAQGEFEKAKSLLGDRTHSNTNYVLNLVENGRLAHLSGDYESSQQWFDLAYIELEKENRRAKIQLGKGVEKVNSLVTNDSAIRYHLNAYEQSMLHSYQALNYLYQNQFESALVEVRRANIVQDQALIRHEKEIFEARQEMATNSSVDWVNVESNYAAMRNRIGNLKNGFQNAYTFYLSAVLYEANGQKNDAYIDYKKALEIFSENKYLQQDVLRLANELGMVDDLALFEKKYGKQLTSEHLTNEQLNSGQVVIFFEQNLIDAKQVMSLNLPIFTSSDDMRFYSVAMPTYDAVMPETTAMVLTHENGASVSEPIVSLQAMVAKQLDEEIPSIIARQVFRIIAKEQLRRNLSRNGGDIGNVIASLYNVASEKADTRSWLTLPGSIQIIKQNMNPGERTLSVSGINGLREISVKVNENRTTLVLITNTGNYTDYKTINL